MREEKERNVELEREIEVYRKESLDFRKQLGASQQQLATVEVEEKDFREKMQLKNREIEGYLNEIQALSLQTNHLKEDVKNLTEELSIITQEADVAQKSSSEYKKLLEDIEKQYIAMESERDTLVEKLQATTEELREQQTFSANLWAQTTSKLKEWENAVKERDFLIQEKDQLLSEMYEELDSMKQNDITLGKYDDTFDGMKKAIYERGFLTFFFIS